MNMSEVKTRDPNLGDLIAFHQAWKQDPRNEGSGMVQIPLSAPEDSPAPRFQTIRRHKDQLEPVARALQQAEIRFQIEDEASRRGFCDVGAFGVASANAIKARLVALRGLTVADADLTPLPDVLAFLRGLEDPAAGAEPGRWLSVQAAADIAAVDESTISKAATAGNLGSNGQKGTKRLIDAIDLCRWMRERAARANRVETDVEVEAKLARGKRG
jgi:hypothetical protein